VLTYSGVQSESPREMSGRLNTYVGGRLYHLVKYGPYFLSLDEYYRCRVKLLNEYYNYLAVSVLKRGRDVEFWNLHKQKFAAAGIDFSYGRLSIALLRRVLWAVTHPPETFEKLKLTRAHGVAKGTATGSRGASSARTNSVQGLAVTNRDFQAPPSPQEKTGLSSM
jgi:hypothetical protein